MARSRSFPVALGALLVLTACQDVSPPTTPDGPAPVTVQQGMVDFEVLANRVPGFGGFFYDQGRPTIYLTDVAQVGAARGVLAGYLGTAGVAESRLQVRRAEYDWGRLTLWFNAATPAAFEVDGTVLVDLDETINRVRVGVEHPGAIGPVRAALLRAGLPEGSFVVDQTEPILQLATLRDRIRPLVGGLQINFPGFLCTLGFNATHGSTGEASFITNSHCTSTQGGVESTPYYQPLQSVDGIQIGVEVADPAYQRNLPGCPRGRRCRRSDSARIKYLVTDHALGQVARTSGFNNGSLAITGNFTITAEDLRDNFPAGTAINKIGRTTGWTRGTVQSTCANIGVSGTSIVQLCQTTVSSSATIVGGGDSGSQTFLDPSGSNITLTGILWGGNSSGTLFVFSPLKNIEQELGALTTF